MDRISSKSYLAAGGVLILLSCVLAFLKGDSFSIITFVNMLLLILGIILAVIGYKKRPRA